MAKGQRKTADRSLDKQRRIQHIVELMASGRYVDGVTSVQLANDWKLAPSYIALEAAEASRLIRIAADDPNWQARIRMMLTDMIREARETSQLRVAVEAVKVLLAAVAPGAAKVESDEESAAKSHAEQVLSELEKRIAARRASRAGGLGSDSAGPADAGSPGADGVAVEGSG